MSTTRDTGNAPGAALVIGANSAIGQAFIREMLDSGQAGEVIAISRGNCPDQLGESGSLTWLVCDNSEQGIRQTCQDVKQRGHLPFSHVLICQGILHDETTSPEKRLEQVSEQAMRHVFNINTIIPMLWLARLLPLVKSQRDCRLAVISARIGSISDNRSGGWYSYRASKAALNMLVQTASVEYARRAPNTKLIAFHPGTTDTPLSKPFQKSVPPEKLFTPAFVAERLLQVMNAAELDGTASYRDWDNQPIAW